MRSAELTTPTRAVLLWSPWAALAAMLAATIVATGIVASQTREQERFEFEAAVRRKHDQIAAQLHTYTSLLRATAGAVSAVGELDLAEFRRFTAPLKISDLYPGLLGIGWTVRLRDEQELERFLDRARRDMGPAFDVWPRLPGQEQFAIYTLEPLDRRNRAALGYDMFTNPVRREAMERARDTGLPATSGPVLLVQEIDPRKQTGFLTYVPVYRPGAPVKTTEQRRAALLGFAYSPYRAGDLLSALTSQGSELVGFEARDSLTGRVLHLSDPEPARPTFTLEQPLVVNGRRWELRYFALPGWRKASSEVVAWGVFLGGSLVSALVFLLLRLQGKGRRLAEEANLKLLRSRQQVQSSEALLRLVTDALPVLVGYLDRDLRYRLLNKAAERWFGVPPDSLIGEPARLANREDTRRRVDQALAGETVEQEAMIDTALGERCVRSTFIPDVSEGRVRGVVVLGHDVTEERAAARERQALLASEQRAREEAQAAVRVRDEFLSVASHELRTPLTTLKLLSDALGRQVQRESQPEHVVRKVEAMTRQVGRLARLVDELLDLSRVQSGRLAMQPVPLDLVAFVRDVVDRFSHEAFLAGCDLELDLPSRLDGAWDPMRLDQVLTNLVSNALKYGAGRPVEVTLREQGGQVVLSVRDHGIGIEPEHQARVFGRFERAVSERHYGGFGLGLWITRQIVESMGGRIRVESTPGLGARFEVTLPLALDAEPPPPPAGQAEGLRAD